MVWQNACFLLFFTNPYHKHLKLAAFVLIYLNNLRELAQIQFFMCIFAGKNRHSLRNTTWPKQSGGKNAVKVLRIPFGSDKSTTLRLT
jgi:hypothetical protein